MEQNREPRNKLKSLRSINIWQRRQKHKMEQTQPLQQMVLGDLDSYMKKNETWPPTYTIHKNKLRMGKRFKYKSQCHKSPRGEHGRKISDIPHSNILTDMSPTARDMKKRINKWDLIKVKSFCMAKENSIKIKREPTVWENIIVNDIRQGPDLQNI